MFVSPLARLSSTILTKFLGDYVEGLDTSNLSVGVLSGDVELRNLKLKRSVLEGVQLPVTVKEGTLGSLTLNVPWRKLSTDPVVARVSDLYLLCKAQRTDEALSEAEEQRRADATKLRMLQLAELTKADMPEQKEEKKENEPKEEAEQGYFQKLITKVVDNIQIFIDRVHIRYEDDVSSKYPFAIGITLEHIHIQSTDSSWKPTFLTVGSAIMNKLLTVRNLAAYFDTKAKFLDYKNDTVLFAKMMRDSIYRDDNKIQAQYVIKPISCDVRANVSKALDLTRPRVILEVVLEEIGLELDPNQFHSILDIIDMLQAFQNRVKYRHARPPRDLRPIADARLWWRFAIDTIHEEVSNHNNSFKWSAIKLRSLERTEYIKLFKYRKTYGEPKMSTTDLARFNQLQSKYTFEDLLLWRKLANAQLIIEAKKKASQGPIAWVTSWFKSDAKKAEEDVSDEAAKELSLMLPNYDPDEESKTIKGLPKEYVNFSVKATLKGGTLLLNDRRAVPIADLAFTNLGVRYALRAGGSMNINCILENFRIGDYRSVDGQRLDLVSPDIVKMSTLTGVPPALLIVAVDIKPIDSPEQADVRVVVDTQPILVTFSRIAVDQIVEFFTVENSVAAEQLKASTTFGLEAMRERASVNLKYALDSSTRLLIKLNVHSATVVLPRNFTDPRCAALVLDLGHLKVNSSLNPRKTDIDPLSSGFKDDAVFYDSFAINLRDVNCFITHNRQQMRTNNDESQWRLIPQFDLLLALKIRNMPVKALPQVKLSGKIPLLEMFLNKAYMKDLWRVVKTLIPSTPQPAPLPPSTQSPVTTAIVLPPNKPSSSPRLPSTEAEDDQEDVFEDVPVPSTSRNDLIKQSKTDKGVISASTISELELFGIGAHLAINDGCIEVHAELDSLSISDAVHSTSKQPLYLIQSHSETKAALLRVGVIVTPPDSPLYEGVGVDVSVEVLRELVVNADRPVLARLVHIALSVVKIFSEGNPLASPPPTLSRPKSRSSSMKRKHSVSHKVRHGKSRRGSKSKGHGDAYHSADEGSDVELDNTSKNYVPPEDLSVRVRASLESVHINLNNRNETFFIATVMGATVGIDIDKSGNLEAAGSIKGLWAKDLNLTPWSELIVLSPTSFAFRSYVPGSLKFPGYEFSIDAKVDFLKVILPLPTVMTLVQYILDFVAMINVLEPTDNNALPSPPITPTGGSIPTALTRLKIDVLVNSPRVTVPCLTKGGELLVASLDRIKVTNTFSQRAATAPLLDTLSVSLDALSVIATHKSSQEKRSPLIRSFILPKASLSANVTRAIAFNEPRSVPDIEIALEAPKVGVVISPSQLLFLLRLLKQNLLMPPENDPYELEDMKEAALRRAMRRESSGRHRVEVIQPVPPAISLSSRSASTSASSSSSSLSSLVPQVAITSASKVEVHYITFALRLQMQKLTVTFSLAPIEITSPIQTSSKTQEPDALFSVALKTLDLGMVINNFSEQELKASAVDLRVSDERESPKVLVRSILRHVFDDETNLYSPRLAYLTNSDPTSQSSSSGDTRKALTMTMKLGQTKRSIEVVLDHPRVIPLPEWSADLYKLLMPLLDDINRTLSEGAPAAPPPTSSTDAVIPLEVYVKLKSLQVIALKDTDVPNTEAIIVYVNDLIVHVALPSAQRSIIGVMLTKLELFHSLPMNLNLTLENILNHSGRLRMTLTALSLVFSHSDVIAILKVYQTWGVFIAVLAPPPTNPPNSPSSDSHSRPSTPASKGVSTPSQRSLRASHGAGGRTPSPSSAAADAAIQAASGADHDSSVIVQKPASALTQTISVQLESLSLMYLDDKMRQGQLSTPMLKIALQKPFKGELSLYTGPRRQMRFHAQSLTVEAYMKTTGIWEPVVEPWDVEVIYNVSDSSVQNVIITTDAHLDATLSVSLLDAVFYFLKVKDDFLLLDPLASLDRKIDVSTSHSPSETRRRAAGVASSGARGLTATASSSDSLVSQILPTDFIVEKKTPSVRDMVVAALPQQPSHPSSSQSKPSLTSSSNALDLTLVSRDSSAAVQAVVFIKNELGIPIIFWTPHSSKKHSLNPRETKPVPIPTLSRVSSKAKDYELFFIIDKPSHHYRALSVAWNVANTTIYSNISPDEPTQRLAVEVFHAGAQNIVTVRSDECVHNKCQSPLRVRLLNASDNMEVASETVAPGDKFGIPLFLVSGLAKIQIRPSESFEWATWDVPLFEQNSASASLIVCEHRSDKSKRFVAAAALRHKKYGDGKVYALTVMPRLVIENCFASSIMFQVWDLDKKERRSGAQGKVRSMNVMEVFDLVTEAPTLAIAFKLPAFSWSDPVLLDEIKTEKGPFDIQIKDKDSNRLRVTIDAHNDGITHSLVVYAKYWIMNHTGLNLIYATEPDVLAAGQDLSTLKPKDLTQKPPLWYGSDYEVPQYYGDESPKNILYYGRERILVKVEKSDWSKPLGIVSGNNSELTCTGKDDAKYSFIVNVRAGPDKFWRSRLVRIYPKSVLVNLTGESVLCKQEESKTSFTLETNSQIPLHLGSKLPAHVQVKYARYTDWSNPIKIDNIGLVQVRCPPLTDKEESIYLNVEQKVTNQIRYIILTSTEAAPFYLVRNLSEYTMLVWQEDAKTKVRLEDYSECDWFWEKPDADDLKLKFKFILGTFQSDTKTVNFSHIKTYGSVDVLNGRKVTITLDAEGRCKTLVCKEVSSREEAKSERLGKKIEPTFEVSISLKSIGLSFVDRRPQELLYAYFGELKFTQSSNEVSNNFEFTVKELQIDNALYLTPYPIVLFSPPVDGKPFLHFAAVIDTRFSGITCFRYFSFAMQEMDLSVDQIFLMHVFDLYTYIWNHIQFLLSSVEKDTLMKGEVYNVLTLKPLDMLDSAFVYYELFFVNPIKANISFASTVQPPDSHLDATSLDMFLQLSGVVSDMSGAPVKLSGMALKHSFGTWDQFTSRILTHYITSALSEFYSLIGSADFLGNPVGLLKGVGEGVYSFFYEPAKGIVTSPKDFGLGIAKGTGKLIGNAFEGIFGAASKITGTVTKGMEFATFDKDYQAQRAANRQQKARHAGDGLLLGTRDFGKGLFQGITGVVTQPIKGAKEEGFVGALKGAGRGLVGVVVKPTVGMVDLVSRTTEGIANTASYIENRKRARKRPPRFFNLDRTILPYDFDKAEGQELLRTLESGLFRKHIYQYHKFLSNSRVLILSDKALIYLKKAAVASTQSSEWVVHCPVELGLQEPVKVDNEKFKAVMFDEQFQTVTHAMKCETPSDLEDAFVHVAQIPKPNIDFEKLGDRPPNSALRPTYKQGFLNKLMTEGMGRGSWRVVFCTVNGGDLVIAHKKSDSKGERIPLSRTFCVRSDIAGQDRDHCFCLVSRPGHALYFQATSEYLCQIWVDKCIENGARMS